MDDNCNGQTDEGGTNLFYKDNDLDGYGNAACAFKQKSAVKAIFQWLHAPRGGPKPVGVF